MKLVMIKSGLLALLYLIIVPIRAQSDALPKFQIEGMTMAVTHMKPMLSFYSSIFGISFAEKEMFNAKLYEGKWGDLKLLFCPAEVAGNTARQNRHQFDIVVPDLAQAAGGQLMGEITEDENALSAGIYDPDQNSILFKQYKKTAATAGIKQVEYKQVDTTTLQMAVYFPADMDPGRSYPAMVFFFGGGWNGGSTAQFEPHARYFSSRGIVCFLADYRVKKRQQTTPFESLKDARSAIRFMRKNAETFHIDPDKIIAAAGRPKC